MLGLAYLFLKYFLLSFIEFIIAVVDLTSLGQQVELFCYILSIFHILYSSAIIMFMLLGREKKMSNIYYEYISKMLTVSTLVVGILLSGYTIHYYNNSYIIDEEIYALFYITLILLILNIGFCIKVRFLSNTDKHLE